MKKTLITLFTFVICAFLMAEEYAKGQMVVKFKPEFRDKIQLRQLNGLAYTGIEECDRLNENFGVYEIRGIRGKMDQLAYKYGIDLIFCFHFSEDKQLSEVIKSYERLGVFDFVSGNPIIPLDRIDSLIPNDPLLVSQWHLRKTACPTAWAISQGDTNVVIAPIDDGIDYTHQDLEANIWINRAEDINHNRRFDPYPPPAGDLDGIDQDGNGFTDDVCGYDFLWSDPDPMPTEPARDNHGTLCGGVAAAVTNNAIGVASFGFKTRLMALKCGENLRINTFAAIEAIRYAANNGAWAIPMSWGGGSFYPPLNDVIQEAWERGAVLSASAGNQYSHGAPRYPACYDRVIATAASNQNDFRSVWGGGDESNYASWVDVSAPGTGVYTTTTNNGYMPFDGTSASAPCVAGLAALLKSAFPDITNAQCTTMIFYSCDTMPDTLYPRRLLGFGRINAGKALSMRNKSDLVLRRFRINDQAGNNNGVPERGEPVGLIIQVRNSKFWPSANNVTATLTTANPYIEILKPTAAIAQIPPGESLWLSSDSFVFRMRDNAPSQKVRFELTIDANPSPYRRKWPIEITCGLPRVILIDDDRGMTYQRYYEGALDSLGFLYRTWDTEILGTPPAETLRRYPVVIWFTGLDSLTSLTSAEQSVLANYLDNGGNLFISGQNIGQDIGDEPFYANYLRARHLQNSSGTFWIVGIEGDPIGGRDTVAAAGGGGANNARSNDVIEPINNALATHYYKDQPTSFAGLRYDGGYKLVYFAFPFEAVDYLPRYIQRPALLRRILTYFGEVMPYALKELTDYSSLPKPKVLTLYPNPCQKYFYLSTNLNSGTPLTIKLFSNTGQLIKEVYSGQWKGKEIYCQTEGLSSGIYFLLLKASGYSISERITILK